MWWIICNTAQKDDFSESSMSLIALPVNEMKRPCSLETDCSLSGQDRWAWRRKRREKFDEGWEPEQVFRLNARSQSSFQSVIVLLGSCWIRKASATVRHVGTQGTVFLLFNFVSYGAVELKIPIDHLSRLSSSGIECYGKSSTFYLRKGQLKFILLLF